MAAMPDTPPVLPPRPGQRAAKPPPQEPEEIYDDFDEEEGASPEPDDVYDDFEDNPPPLPPHPEDVYDDAEEAKPPELPRRPPAAKSHPLTAPQETYDDLDEVGPIVQTLRQLPPRPAPVPPPSLQAKERSPYELNDDEEDDLVPEAPPLPPPPPENENMDSIYEVEPDVPPVPPAPRPQRLSEDQQPPKLPPHPPKTPTTPKSPTSSQAAQALPVVGLQQLSSARAGLRKVSLDKTAEDSSDPKMYGETPSSVADAKKRFQDRVDGKPEILAPKPAVGKVAGNSTAAKPNSLSTGIKAVPSVQSSNASSSPSGPDVTFLPRASKDKQTTAPVSPAPAALQAPKPVKHEPQVQFEEPDEIYDEAASFPIDILNQYDWYHGCINRQDGEARVKSVGKSGAYLVRVSDKDPIFPYSLVVFHNGSINNLRIRKRTDSTFALGAEKAEELTFKDVPAMIEHHKKNNVVLLGGKVSAQVKLQHPAPKS